MALHNHGMSLPIQKTNQFKTYKIPFPHSQIETLRNDKEAPLSRGFFVDPPELFNLFLISPD